MKQKDEEPSTVGNLIDLTIKGDLKTIKTILNIDSLLENYVGLLLFFVPFFNKFYS